MLFYLFMAIEFLLLYLYPDFKSSVASRPHLPRINVGGFTSCFTDPGPNNASSSGIILNLAFVTVFCTMILFYAFYDDMQESQANIPAAYLSGSMEWAEQQEILRELQCDTCKYKLLYVTPEKVAK